MRPIHALSVLLVAAALAGCGGDGDDGGGAGTTSAAPEQTQTEPSRTTAPAEGPDGAEVYASSGCGNCHVLAAAGSDGRVGPNLDDAQPDFASVQSQVENGGGGMPAFEGDLSPEEIEAVSRYVAENAGRQ